MVLSVFSFQFFSFQETGDAPVGARLLKPQNSRLKTHPRETDKGVKSVFGQRKLVIEPAWCKGCGICAAFCPKQVLEIVNEKTNEVVYRFQKTAQNAKKRPQKKEELRPDPQPIAEPIYRCSDCGSALIWTKKKDGTDMSPAMIKEYSSNRYGRTLCASCARKIEASKRKSA